ncbi:hypothetical protein KXJ74_14090 [Acinetobacter johnsonii]|nr:hypothetical protein KXJ74_14090 [Acinetobacter johnsonii]
MKKEIDIFGWKYELSKQETQFIQAILVLTIMCLILMKGLTSPLALKFFGASTIGAILFFIKFLFFS